MTEKAKTAIEVSSVIPATEWAVAEEITNIKTDKRFLDLVHRVTTFETQVKAIKVKSDEDEAVAVESLGAIKKAAKEAEAMRKGIVAFPSKFVRMVNDTFRGLTDSLKRSEAAVAGEIQKYRREKEARARKEQERLQRELDRLKSRMEKAGVEVPEIRAAVQEPENVVRTETAVAHEQRRWTFEVEDIRALAGAVAEGTLPADVIAPNPKAIRALIAAGMRQIPGVRVFQEAKIITRTT